MCASAKINTLLGEVHIKEEASKDLLGRVVSLRGMQKGLTAKQKAGKSKCHSVSEVLPIAEEVEEWETKDAPSAKNAQSSCVTEMMQHVWSGLLQMGLAAEVSIATEDFCCT